MLIGFLPWPDSLLVIGVFHFFLDRFGVLKQSTVMSVYISAVFMCAFTDLRVCWSIHDSCILVVDLSDLKQPVN